MDPEFFPIILNERLSYRRKFRKEPLSEYLFTLADILVKNENLDYMNQLESSLPFFLSEAEIFYSMNDFQANDALKELGLLATMFHGTNHYEKICCEIKKIRASYPVPEYGQSDVETYFLPRDDNLDLSSDL